MSVGSTRSRPARKGGGALVALVVGLVLLAILAAVALLAAPQPAGRPTHLAEIERAILRRLTPPNPIKPHRQVAPADTSQPAKRSEPSG